MKKIILYILCANIFLNAFGIESQSTITSNYLFRGVSQTQNQPAITTKVIAYQKGFHIGIWGSRVSYDNNISNNMYKINNKILNADSEVNIFLGYEIKLGEGSLGVGYIDRRYLVDEHLDSNISNEYYVFVNFKSNVNTIIKVSYDILNILDPIYVEASISQKLSSSDIYMHYGTHLNSKSSYWDTGTSVDLSHLNIRGRISVTYSQFSFVDKKDDYRTVISYSF